jgi:hypothetical protein
MKNNRAKRVRRTRRFLGMSESILKLFPKTSRMGQFEGPAQWERGDLTKAENPKRAKTQVFHY